MEALITQLITLITSGDKGSALIAVLLLAIAGCGWLMRNRETRLTVTEDKLSEKDEKIMELLNKIEDLNDKQDHRRDG